jgi:hypothetical protein
MEIRVDAEILLPNCLGLPFPADLDGDGRHELLFLQSPGLFYSELHALLTPVKLPRSNTDIERMLILSIS